LPEIVSFCVSDTLKRVTEAVKINTLKTSSMDFRNY